MRIAHKSALSSLFKRLRLRSGRQNDHAVPSHRLILALATALSLAYGALVFMQAAQEHRDLLAGAERVLSSLAATAGPEDLGKPSPSPLIGLRRVLLGPDALDPPDQTAAAFRQELALSLSAAKAHPQRPLYLNLPRYGVTMVVAKPLSDGLTLALAVPAADILKSWYARLPRYTAILLLPLCSCWFVLIGYFNAAARARIAENKQAASEDRLTFAARGARTGYWTYDILSGAFVFSSGFWSLLGRGEQGGPTSLDYAQSFVHPADRAALQALVSAARAGREISDSTLRWLHADGHFLWLCFKSDTLAHAQKREGVALDITALKRQEDLLRGREKNLENTIAELEGSRSKLRDQTRTLILLAERYAQQRKRAEDADQAKSQFLEMMSHELRTPLNAIIGFSEIMKTELYGPLGDAHYAGYASDIHSAGQELAHFINDVLDMAHLNSGQWPLSVQRTELLPTTREVLRFVEHNAHYKNVRIRLDVPQDLYLDADRRALKQILLNVLSNAVKLTPGGEEVTLAAARDEDGITLAVTYRTSTVRRSELENTAESPTDANEHRLGQYRGSGLNLALAKSLAELHGGWLSVEGTPDAGTTVTVTLPQGATPQTADVIHDVRDQAANG